MVIIWFGAFDNQPDQSNRIQADKEFVILPEIIERANFKHHAELLIELLSFRYVMIVTHLLLHCYHLLNLNYGLVHQFLDCHRNCWEYFQKSLSQEMSR